MYEDDNEDSRMVEPPAEQLEPTPEVEDSYVNTKVMLPRGDSMTRGRVIHRKRDADGNLVGRSNDNPILDTQEYEVEFANGEVTELTGNMIVEAMYAQCDNDGNEYVLLNSLVDYRKSENTMSPKDQKIVAKGRSSLRRSTVGWQICCEWKGGSRSRILSKQQSIPSLKVSITSQHSTGGSSMCSKRETA